MDARRGRVPSCAHPPSSWAWRPWGVVLVLTGAWLLQDNPTIDGTSRGDDYTCAAPYDTVLGGADNRPGGEPPRDSADIAERCRDAGTSRFVLASVIGGAGLLGFLGVLGGSVLRRLSRPSRAGS